MSGTRGSATRARMHCIGRTYSEYTIVALVTPTEVQSNIYTCARITGTTCPITMATAIAITLNKTYSAAGQCSSFALCGFQSEYTVRELRPLLLPYIYHARMWDNYRKLSTASSSRLINELTATTCGTGSPGSDLYYCCSELHSRNPFESVSLK